MIFHFVARYYAKISDEEPDTVESNKLIGYQPNRKAHELFGQAAETGAAPEEERGGGAAAGDVTAGEGAGEGGPAPTVVGGLLGNASDLIMPQFVIALEGTENMLCERVMHLPQRSIQGSHYDEINMLRRLAEFRADNTEDLTILKFFDEANIHPFLVELVDEVTKKERDPDYIFDLVCAMIGDPIPGFGLSPEEEETIRRLENEQRRLQEEAGRLEKQLIEDKALREHEEKMEKWAETFEKLQMEEEKILSAQSEPLRFYLMKYIFPTLSKGLMEVARLKPDDPVDYLAEFLFRENPEGKMFDPSYTKDGERILECYEKEVAPAINKTLNK